MMDFGAVDQTVQFFVADPVVLDCLQKFCSGDFLFLEHELPDRAQDIRAGAQTACLRTCPVVDGTAFTQIPAVFHTGGEEGGSVGERLQIAVGPFQRGQGAADLIDPVVELLVDTCHDFIKSPVGQQTARIGTQSLALQGASAVDDHFEHLGRIDVGCVMPAVFLAGEGQFHAAHDCIVARFFKGTALSHHGRDG